MIYREVEDGWLLISQLAHAWLAGEIVTAWGNETFMQPSPRETLILATHLHDIGWSTWDARPRIDERGFPVNFLNTTLEETVPIWRSAIEIVNAIDPMASLLVSQHASTIYSRRLKRGADPVEKQGDVKALLAEQEEIRSRVKERLADQPLYKEHLSDIKSEAAYRWLRACDLLSLLLCSDVFADEGQIPDDQRPKSGTLQP